MVQHAAINHGTISAGVVVADDGVVVGTASVLSFSAGSVSISSGTATIRHQFVGAKVFETSTQSINDNTFTAITFDEELYDTSAFHSNVSQQSRLTAPQDGYYAFGAQASFPASNGTGQRFVGVSFGGGTTNADYLARSAGPGSVTNGSFPRHLNCSGEAFFSSGQYIEMHVYQSTGTAMSFGGTANGTASFWMHLVGV